MKSFILTYPGFQALPRGIKQMLVASESAFFSGAKPSATNGATGKTMRRHTSQPQLTHRAGGRAGDLNAWLN